MILRLFSNSVCNRTFVGEIQFLSENVRFICLLYVANYFYMEWRDFSHIKMSSWVYFQIQCNRTFVREIQFLSENVKFICQLYVANYFYMECRDFRQKKIFEASRYTIFWVASHDKNVSPFRYSLGLPLFHPEYGVYSQDLQLTHSLFPGNESNLY